MKKRIVSLLLAVVLVLGLMPTALAAGCTFDPTGTIFTQNQKADGFPKNLGDYFSVETTPVSSGDKTTSWNTGTNATSVNVFIQNGSLKLDDRHAVLTFTFKKDCTFWTQFLFALSGSSGSYVSILHNDQEVAKWDQDNLPPKTGSNYTYQLDVKAQDTLKFDFYLEEDFDTPCNMTLKKIGCIAAEPQGATITFDPNGGTGTMEKLVLADGTGKLTANAFTREDYTFLGWATSTGGEVVYEDGAPITEALTGDVTLYAVWKSSKVTVHFDVGGYKLDTLPEATQATFADQVVEPTATVTLPSVYPSFYPQTNVNFGGWYVKTDDAENPYGALVSEKRLSGLDVDLSKYDTSSGEITFIVKWKPTTYNVVFDPNGGTGTMADLTGLQAEVPTALPKNQFTKEGYAFVGWKKLKSDYASIAYEDGVNIQEQIGATDDGKTITLYAWWKEVSDATTATVTFDYSDGVTPAATVYVEKNTAIGDKIPAAPAREGYRFTGWALSTNLAKKLTADTVIDASCTYKALWSKYDYKIIFNKNASDATGEMANQWADYDTSITLNKCAFTREGYDFAGWSTTSYGSTVSFKDGASFRNDYDDYYEESDYGEEVKLYAVWTEAKSDAQKEAEEKLDAAAALISKNYQPVFGTDINLLAMASKRLTDDLKGVTVTMTEAASKKDLFTAATASADLDGTLHYKWNSEPDSYTSSTDLYMPVTFTLTYNGYTKTGVSATVIIGLDEAKALEALKAEAARITLPTSVSSGSDLPTLPHYQQSASDSSKYNSWAEIKWTSNDAAIKVSNNYDTSGNNWVVTVTPAKDDTDVTLTATLTYSGKESITCSKVFTVKVLGSVKAVNYQELLDTVFGADNALYDPGVGTSAVIDKSAVTTDIHYPTTKDMSRVCYSLYGQGFDGKYTPIVITSSNNNVIEAPDTPNSARTMVYRPLPGQPDATVTVTVKIYDRPNGPRDGDDLSTMKVLASKDITLTVKALTKSELDEAAAFMSKVCTEDVYWEGIRKANTSRDSITDDMQWFMEIVPNGDGYKFIRNSDDSKWTGVLVDDIDGWYASEQYRAFRSSKPTVIQSENLLIARDESDSTGNTKVFPKYDTAVKIDSVLTHGVYGKYYEKFQNDPNYAQFAKFYKQPVFTVVTVKGTDGVNPNAEQWTLDISVEGAAFDKNFTDLTTTYTCGADSYATMLDALKTTLTANSYTYGGSDTYMSSVTDADGTTLAGGDDRFGPYSGWMFTVNGSAPMLNSTTYARIDQYVLQKGDVLRFYYVACPTDDGQHTSSAYGVDSEIHVTKEVTHEEDGSQWYECAVCGVKVTETIPATGHTWSEDVTYTWNERHTTCTAVRNCTADDGGEDSETANATYAVVTEPTSSTAGLGRWTAVFENEAFQTQTYDVTLPATGGNTSGGTTKPSGSSSKTETSTNRDGSKTVTQTRSDGVIVKTTTAANGSTGTVKTTTDAKGNTVVKAEAEVSAKAVADAKKAEMPVTAPIEVKAVESRESAPVVSLSVPKGAGTVKVEVPVTNLSSGTVAVLVKADGSEELIKTCVNGENGVIVSVQGDVTVKIVDNSKSFADTQNHWAADDVNFVASRDLFGGTGRDSFSPNSDMSRAMLWVVLARLNNEDTTAANGAWYERGQLWAQENGISDGSEPNGALTREQLVTMLWRASGSPAADGAALDGFTDTDSVSGYASDAMRWAVNAGLISGIGSTLKPHGDASRAQLATIIARYIRTVA